MLVESGRSEPTHYNVADRKTYSRLCQGNVFLLFFLSQGVFRTQTPLNLFCLPLASQDKNTECPKIYRKSVLHLLKYTANLYLSRGSTDLRYILGHSV